MKNEKKSIVSLYIEKYAIKDDENEVKRVRRFVKKLREEKSIFFDFPFDYMLEEEQLLFLNYLMTVLPERQIMANMEKIDVDRDFTKFVYQSEESKEITNCTLKNELYDYSPICLNGEYWNSRIIIRSPEYSIHDVLQYLQQTNVSIVDNYMLEKTLFRVSGIGICNYGYIKDFIDYVVNVILQMMVYKVINNGNIKTLDVIGDLIVKVDEMNDLLSEHLSEKKIKWSNARKKKLKCLESEKISDCFSEYVSHRSKLYEEVSIKKVLKKEMQDKPLLFCDVSEEYIAEKKFISEDEIITENIIITEGKHVDEYRNKIEIVKKFIDIMAQYGGRQCYSWCLQDLKVYFREIFVSKSSYDKRMAPVIVKEYIDQVEKAINEEKEVPDFNKQCQYMFVREKLSRGYFREKGLAKEYIAKIDFENKLYDLLLKSYLFYDVQESLEFISEINASLLTVYERYFLN